MTKTTIRTPRTQWLAKAAAAVLLALHAPSAATAQTAVSAYRPGVTTDGAVYFLPKTAIRITVQIEKTTYTPGDFCKYADRYLRLKDVPTAPAQSYRITAVRQEPVAVADTTKAYAVKFDARTSAANIALSDDGVLLAVNATPHTAPTVQPFVPARRSPQRNPRDYMSEEILAAGSTAKMAELTARDIYEIRESRNLLTRGQADNMPKDGEQLRLMLSQLDAQDRAMTSLFAGTTVRDTTEHVLTVVPDKETARQLIFRFSQKLGMVDDDDLAGEPYYIKIANLRTVLPPEVDNSKKKQQKQVPGIYVNVPGKMRATIFTIASNLSTADLPAPQFGNTELLSGALFNKRFTTHLWLNPVTGAVDRQDLEQPK